MRDKVAVIGSLNYDIILKSSRRPEQGETMTVDQATSAAGGKGANQAVQAAKLGIPACLVGCVGEDPQGAFLLRTAQKYGLDTSFVRTVPGPSGMGIINALDDGSVFASIVRGANYAITTDDIDRAESALKEAAIVVLQLEIPLEVNEYAIRKAKACGCRVLLNAAPASEVPEEYLRNCDIIVVNEVEASFYLKEEIRTIEQAKAGAAKMARQYDTDIIITLGKAGSVVCDNGYVSYIPSKNVHAIESTGAGDSFIGAAAFALLHGMSLTRACKFATCCSAITVCRVGAQNSMPTLDEVSEDFRALQQNP